MAHIKYPVGSVDWTHIVNPAQDELKEFGSEFRIHPLDLQSYNNGSTYPKIQSFREYIFLKLAFLWFNAKEQRTELQEMDFFVGPTYLRCISTCNFPGFQSFVQTAETTRNTLQIDSGVELLMQFLDRIFVASIAAYKFAQKNSTVSINSISVFHSYDHMLEQLEAVAKDRFTIKISDIPAFNQVKSHAHELRTVVSFQQSMRKTVSPESTKIVVSGMLSKVVRGFLVASLSVLAATLGSLGIAQALPSFVASPAVTTILLTVSLLGAMIVYRPIRRKLLAS